MYSIGVLNIDQKNGICFKTDFDPDKTHVKTIVIEKDNYSGNSYTYSGMICKEKNLPHGWGRAVQKGNSFV